MPSGYAHYRFGGQLLPSLPRKVREIIEKHRGLYDVGLHGPDIFLYYDPIRKNRVTPLSRKYHAQSGSVFFGRVCRGALSEQALAYLYGLMAHYSLDALCHPFVYRCTQGDTPGHLALETEFDRYLLEKDGKCPPHVQDCGRHLKLTEEECAVVAGFYPEITGREIAQAVRNMAWSLRQLARPNPLFRKVMTFVLGFTPYRKMLMTEAPDPDCARWDGELEQRYHRALALYPTLLEQITKRFARGEELGQEFTPPFDIY